MTTSKNWSELTWQEKREVRFQRWLEPQNVQFDSSRARQLYRERVSRFIRAIKLEEGDRVPVMLPVGNFPVYYSGFDLHTVIHDHDKLKQAWYKFMNDFEDMDYFRGPTMTISGKLSEALDLKNYVWPGHGLPREASMAQFVEGEYMQAGEYEWWLTDPSDYHVRAFLPRTAGAFAAFRKLPRLGSLQGTALIGALTDPEVRKGIQHLLDLGEEYQRWQAVNKEISDSIIKRGYVTFRSSGQVISAPFDHFADALRGTRGITMDIYRQPDRLHEAMQRYLKIIIQSVRNSPITSCPVVMIPLHKGDDVFMSHKQFETFYWPYLREVCLALIEEGLVPLLFAEGRYTERLEQITDLPRSGVIWYFDQTDMAKAKKILGDKACLAGNVPTSVVMKGSPDQVREHCRRLIEICAPGGGYILTAGASIDSGNIENLRAMMEATYKYGVYQKPLNSSET